MEDQIKSGADALVIIDFPCGAETEVKEGKRVVLIRRGEIPKEIA